MSSTESIAVRPHNIVFTTQAADKVYSLLEEENDPNVHLRVYITGGGCSGFQYGFTFDSDVQEDDFVIQGACSNPEHSVSLLIDAMSYHYLKNAEIDFTQGVAGEQFVIRNPNAKTTCGCGSSFSIDEEEV